MDPDACLRRIVEAMADDEPQEVANGCQDLLDWYGRGGFAPAVGWDYLAPLLAAVMELSERICQEVDPPQVDPRQ